MRNIFDQYDQPENRLTHALITVLDQDRTLLIPFLRWLGITDTIPNPLRITQQQVPGTVQEFEEELVQAGLPDAAVFHDDGWAVLIECKVQAKITTSQIERHRATAKRYGIESPWVVVISVEKICISFPDKTLCKQWQEVYVWVSERANASFWAMQLVKYMQIFEQKMLSQDYQIRGTITVFDGLKFDDQNPYTYAEAKRLIRLLGDLFQARNDLHDIGVDPNGKRRVAITGTGADAVWDFLPLVVAKDAKEFTYYPHLTIGIRQKLAVAAVVVPNSVKGGFRTKLSLAGTDGFLKLILELEKNLRPILKKSVGSKPMICAVQRHYRSLRSDAEVDAYIEADLRTISNDKKSGVKYQPQWVEAIYQLLVRKRANIQFWVEIQFQYTCPNVRSANAEALFADAWKALSPLIDFVVK